MQVSNTKWQTILIIAMIFNFFSGCMPTHPVAPTRFYILNPSESEKPLVTDGQNPLPLSVEIASLRLPQYLEKPRIVTRSSDNRLIFSEYHQWGGNLRKDMVRVMARNMSHILATPHIFMAPYRPKTPPDFRVELEVMQFERDADSRVQFSCQWWLTQGREEKTPVARITHLVSPEIPGETDFDGTVLAMEKLLGELSRDICQTILTYPPKKPVP